MSAGVRGLRRVSTLLVLFAGLLLFTGWCAAATAQVDAAAPVAPVAPPGSTPAMTIATFNIRYGTANDGANAWPHRRAALLATLRALDADILALQEGLHGQLQEIDEGVPGYQRVGVGRDDGLEGGEYAAILVRTDRFTIEEDGTFWLSGTPEVPGSRTFGNTLPRICTWVRLADRREPGRSMVFWNVHLDHLSATSRERSAELLLERLAAIRVARPEAAHVILGDFNCALTDAPVVTLLGESSGLVDSGAGVIDRGGTYHEFGGGVDGPCIDHVLIDRRLRPLSWRLERRAIDGRYPSDHFPVVMVVTWADVPLPGQAPEPGTAPHDPSAPTTSGTAGEPGIR